METGSPVLLKQYMQGKKRTGRVKKKSTQDLSNEGGKYLKKEEHGMKCKFIGTRHDLVFYMFKNIRVFSSVKKQHLHIGIVKQCAMIFKNY